MAEEAETGRTVAGVVNYFGGAPAKPTYHAQDHGKDNWQADRRGVPFHDGRSWAAPPRLDREGVALARHESEITDFFDSAQVADKYPREVEALIRQLTGAVKVVALAGAFLRFSPRTRFYKSGANTQPAHFPHNDFTPNSAPGLARDGLSRARPEVLKPGQRIVGFNVWRVISEPPQDIPLAVCDARTIAPGDLVAADGIYDYGEPPYRVMESYLLRHNPAHRWIYFRDMRLDEVLVFRGYGSGESALPGAAHTAFDDPTCPSDAPGRISVEARAYAVFDP